MMENSDGKQNESKDSDANPYKCNHCTAKFSDIKQAQTHFFNNHVNNVVKTEKSEQLEELPMSIKIENSTELNGDLNALKIKQESSKEVNETDRVDQIKKKFLSQVKTVWKRMFLYK
jgi:hypothetical protein